MEEEKKKAWTTPTLIPIVRRKPEEGILNGCKGGGSGEPAGAEAACVVGSVVMCCECEVIVHS